MATSDEKQVRKDLQARLARLQQPLREAKRPVIVVLEGCSGAGKGKLIGDIIAELDPRGYSVHDMDTVKSSEALPFLAPYWSRLPRYGELAIFDHSWYHAALPLPDETVQDIITFERQLADDGYLILKYFLSIDKKEQRKRLEALESQKSTAWRVNKADWKQNKHHGDYVNDMTAMIEATNIDYAPWHIIDGYSNSVAAIGVLTHLVTAIEQGIDKLPSTHGAPTRIQPLLKMPHLSQIDLSHCADDSTYKTELKVYKKSINRLQNELFHRNIPVVLAFEGWDAAGKGGAIRRLTWALDPRGFDVIPIASPSPEELNHHYLWRFWRQILPKGHISIFDRSWYGRVMVERVEHFATPQRWRSAYQEINEFEAQLAAWGAVILKFWIHIDPETQLMRFNDRVNTPEKQYKITEEDWRNREKWPDYEVAVDEMIQRTSTPYAPWIIIEGNDKKYARLKVLKTVEQALQQRLND